MLTVLGEVSDSILISHVRNVGSEQGGHPPQLTQQALGLADPARSVHVAKWRQLGELRHVSSPFPDSVSLAVKWALSVLPPQVSEGSVRLREINTGRPAPLRTPLPLPSPPHGPCCQFRARLGDPWLLGP